MRWRTTLTLVLVITTVVLAGCGGGGSSKSIWPDVPIPADARNTDIRLPLPMRLLIQTAVRASNRGSEVNVDKFDFVGYTTAQSPQQVAEFYNAERMSAAGWDADQGMNCQTAMSESGGLGGGFCMFSKDSGRQQSLLIIATSRDDNDRNTNIFFVRFDGQLSGQ
jgi:hypothetical protein